MRLKLVDVTSKQVELELDPRGQTPRTVAFDDVVTANGVVTHEPGRVGLRPVTAKQFITAALNWNFRRGNFRISSPATVEDFHAEADYLTRTAGGVPFVGTLSLSKLAAPDAKLKVDDIAVSLDLQLERAAFDHHAADGGHLRCAQFVVKNVQTTLSGYLLRAEEVIATSFRASWDDDDTTFEASRVTVKGLTVHSDNIDIRIDELELAKGISVRGGAVRIPELVIVRGNLDITDVLQLGGTEQVDETGARMPLVDWLFLDQLSGRVDVDLTVDATVPVLGKRKATHHFRLGLEDGTIDYREFESALASLESFVVAINLREDDRRLVLERGLPGLRKPVLSWDLSEVELALAKTRTLRLRTLPKLRVIRSASEPPADADGESSLALRCLDFDNIDVAIKLAPLHANARGGLRGIIPKVSLGELSARGAIWYRPDSQDTPQTELEFQAQDLHAELRDLRVGRVLWTAAMIHFASLHSASITFAQYRPQRLQTTLSGLRLEGVSIVV